MIKEELTIKNRLGLHARAAARLVQTASRFRAEVLIERDGLEVNGKSIMGLLMLAAPLGSQIRVLVKGEDAEAAMTAVRQLIEDKFGEE